MPIASGLGQDANASIPAAHMEPAVRVARFPVCRLNECARAAQTVLEATVGSGATDDK